MEQRQILQFLDDLTGEEIDGYGSETVTFTLDGQSYTIDLTSENADRFRSQFDGYIAVASKVRKRAGVRGRSASQSARTTQRDVTAKDIHEWARSAGHEFPERGRIPESARQTHGAAN